MSHPPEGPGDLHAGVLATTVTLVCGSTVCVTDVDGTIQPGSHLGVYHRDVRVVSRLAVTVDGVLPPLLSAQRVGPSRAQHVWAVDTDVAGVPTALLIRTRDVGEVVTDTFELRSFADPIRRVVTVHVATDFATLHKGVTARPPVRYACDPVGLHASTGRIGVAIHSEVVDGEVAAGEVIAGEVAESEVVTDGGRIAFAAQAAPGAPCTFTTRIRPTWDAAPPTPLVSPSVPALHVTADDTRWAPAIASAAADLHALRMPDEGSGATFIAAGAPWYLALFGRDSLLTAYNALIADVDGAMSLLEVLAHHQGRAHVGHRLEQPGRILHELRSGGMDIFTATAGEPYYGTADAPALFVSLLAEAHRWGADPARVAALLPAARAAVGWCLTDGDADGDGWVEYGGHAGGLANQGWKDSGDAMVHADGSQATGPIALCEVQAYLIRALEDLAGLELALGDGSAVAGLRAEADTRRRAFRRDFWLPEDGIIAMALDGDKQPLRVASSNMGHCLWAGAVDEEVAAMVARRLMRPDMLGDWGVRTLASSAAAYNPLGYHLGSIWPHDSALVAAGLRRYGHDRSAVAVVDRLLRVADMDDGRLPELYGGLDADDVAAVVAYPTACSPQAWSASAPLLLLRTVLGLDPDLPAGRVALRPVPDRLTPRLVEGAVLGGHAVHLSTGPGDIAVTAVGGEALPWALGPC